MASQRRNTLIEANIPKEKPKFGSVDFGNSPLEEIDEEREQKRTRDEQRKKEELKNVQKIQPSQEGKMKDEIQEAKKRGRKKKNQDEKCVVKTYSLTEKSVRFLEVYNMFHKEKSAGMTISQAIIDYINKEDPEIKQKIELLFGSSDN